MRIDMCKQDGELLTMLCNNSLLVIEHLKQVVGLVLEKVSKLRSFIFPQLRVSEHDAQLNRGDVSS
jgi:hypothetical protein